MKVLSCLLTGRPASIANACARLHRSLAWLLFSAWLLLGSNASAITYPTLTSLLYGNSSVNQVGQTSIVSGTGLPYRYLVPKNYSAANKYPVIIFLHGVGERGDANAYDNAAQLEAGTNSANGALSVVSTANPDNQTNYPCFFVAPQAPHMTWSSSICTDGISDIIKMLKTYYSIDEDRICLTGLSMGAFGTWDVAADHLPGIFSCLVPLSGGDTGTVGHLQEDMPIWAFHAADDTTVGVTDTEAAVNFWRYSGRKIIFTRYANGGHNQNVWKAAYQTPLLMPWIFAQKRGQPIVGIYDVKLRSSVRSNSLTLAATTGTAPNFTRIGWSNSNIANGASPTDGVANGTTTYTSASSKFITNNTVTTSHRIGVWYHDDTSNKNWELYFDVAAVVSDTEITLSSAAPSAKATGKFTILPRGTEENPWPGTGGGTDWNMSNIPLTTGFNLVNVYGESSSYGSSRGGNTTINEPLWFIYTPPTGDSTAPVLAITNPATGPTYTTSGTLNLSGTSSDNNVVTSLTWASSLGYSGTATGLNSWSINNVPLVAGYNKITVKAEDANHNESLAILDVTYTGTSANQIPRVAAGNYQMIVWPANSLALTGTVSDDGLPAGAVLNQRWSKVSGPGPVIFSNQTSPTSTATFFQPGSYTLRLTASDTALSASDDVIITVRPNGTLMTAINCGATVSGTAVDGTIYAPDPLTGSSSSSTGAFDGASDQFVYQKWRYTTGTAISYNLPMASGTYDVLLHFGETITSPLISGVRLFDVVAEGQLALASVDVIGDAGRYVAYDRMIRTVVTDGTLNLAFNKVVANPQVSGFVVRAATLGPRETWLRDHFGTNAGNQSIAGDSADPDSDGLPNLLEYAEKLDPNQSSLADAPQSQTLSISGTSYLSLSFRRLIAPSDVLYTVEASSDLTNWVNVTSVVGTPVNNLDGTETVTIRDSSPLNSSSRRFLRLRVE